MTDLEPVLVVWHLASGIWRMAYGMPAEPRDSILGEVAEIPYHVRVDCGS